MNVEETRLQSFNDWPSGININPESLARAGFFYEKSKPCVECFSCHLQIVNCTDPEQIVLKHRQLRPQCLFLVDATTSGNVPYISTNTDEDEQQQESVQDLTDESMRLQTFHSWPITQIVSPERLARAGFYSLQNSDFTKCAFCLGIVGYWESGDDPDYEHKRYFPNCPYVRSHINARCTEPLDMISVNDSSLGNNSSHLPNINIVREGNLAELGVHAHKGPKKPKYGTLEARLVSFQTWPRELLQTPDALAHAGFYYEGSGDQVRCFHCDGGLKYWDPHDEPWTEHARWFPYCAFVALLKGQDFISACAPELDPTTAKELQASCGQQQQHNNNSRRPNHHQHGSTGTTSNTITNSSVGGAVGTGIGIGNTSSRRRQITERELQIHMLSAPATAALGVGLHVGRVKQAIREKLERTGCGFANGDALIEATLNLQHDEEDLADDDQQQHNPSTNSRSSVSNSRSNSVVSNLLVSDVIAKSLREAKQAAAANSGHYHHHHHRQNDQNRQIGCGVSQEEGEGEEEEEFDRASSRNKSLSKNQHQTHDQTKATHSVSAGNNGGNSGGVVSLEEENRLLKEARLCKICMDHEVGIVFLPCGHLTTCINCAPNLQDCPVCRCAIKATVRTFLS